jgi:hypothetical protein
MNVQVQPHVTTTKRHLPFECVALVLQGGGALGAYQAGVYEALAEAGIHPDWIAGISIGAINAAIIAGDPPHSRVDRLREFWTQVTADGLWPFAEEQPRGEAASLCRRLQGIQYRSSDLSREELRGPFKGLRVFALRMEEHWRAGYHDARRTLRHREVLERPANHESVFTFDLVADGR